MRQAIFLSIAYGNIPVLSLFSAWYFANVHPRMIIMTTFCKICFTGSCMKSPHNVYNLQWMVSPILDITIWNMAFSNIINVIVIIIIIVINHHTDHFSELLMFKGQSFMSACKTYFAVTFKMFISSSSLCHCQNTF